MIKEELLHSRLLRESLFFNQLSDAEAREILAHTHISDYQRGEYVLTQGQIPEFMMFLLSGELFTLRSTPEGSEIIIRMLSAGETCMEAILFPPDPSPIMVRATKASKALCIEADFITQYAKTNHKVSHNLLIIIAKYYRAAILQIDSITLRDATYRVGRYLLSLSLNRGQVNQFDLIYKKSDIANYLGMTPETLSRSLKELQKLGVKVESGHVHLSETFLLGEFCDAVDKKRCICTTSLSSER